MGASDGIVPVDIVAGLPLRQHLVDEAKEARPDQCAPVMIWAIFVSEA